MLINVPYCREEGCVCVWGGSLILDINLIKGAQIMYEALNNLLTHSMLKLFSRE